MRHNSSKVYKSICNVNPYDLIEKLKLKLEKGNLSAQYQIYFDPILMKENYKDIKFSS